ncbi:MAG: DUF4097 domain-containing protein [Coriobacteriales bacterium]|jgi:hypothetical protein|nr:DUF4097 domain-containing protein [Coriobacteriales bacterium]
MSKTAKILLCVVGGVFVVGGILATIGFGLGGVRPVRFDGLRPTVLTDDATTTVNEHWDNITAVDIDSSIVSLKMIPGDSFSLTGSYPADLVTLDIHESGGTLRISSESQPRPWFLNIFNFGSYPFAPDKNYELVLTYPADAEFSSVSFVGDLGNLDVSSLRAKSLSARLNAGNLTGKDIRVDDFDVDMDLGNCEINGLDVAQRARAALNLGSLKLTSAKINDLTAELDLGSAVFEGTLWGTATLSLNMGEADLRLQNSEAELSYLFRASMGDVSLNGISKSSGVNSSTQSSVANPTCTLDVKTNMGSITVSTS